MANLEAVLSITQIDASALAFARTMQPSSHIPEWREWLGDVAVVRLFFEPDLPDEECERLYYLFPEALFVIKMVRTDDELLYYRYSPKGLIGPIGSVDLSGITWEK